MIFLAAAGLAGCATVPDANPLAVWSPSDNFDHRKPRLVVLHATEMDSTERALQVLKSRNPSGRVSAHYLISEDGKIFQLVEESKRAWHAGAGRWQGMDDINSVSIGIELDNDGSEAFTEPQIDALIRLLADVCGRHGIPAEAVIGHGDMAPTRKRDPGILFPWRRLAESGFGVWYADDLPEAPADFDAEQALQAVGYDTRDLPAAVNAFRRRFRGSDGSGLDAYDAAILYHLIQQMRNDHGQRRSNDLLPGMAPAAGTIHAPTR
jgi:N-acetylmuramoyl-L-alanine amidase